MKSVCLCILTLTSLLLLQFYAKLFVFILHINFALQLNNDEYATGI